jgi:hypothetical protein
MVFQTNRAGKFRANVIPATGKNVVGGLYELALDDLSSLDRSEGHPAVYRREYRKVQRGNEPVDAYVYVMPPPLSRDGYGLPDDSRPYLETIAQGYVEWGIPIKFLEASVKRTAQLAAGTS